MKKIISVILATCLIFAFGVFDFTAFAASNGMCGDDAYWSYDSTSNTLSITGTGAMWDFTSDGLPWKSYKTTMTTVTIENTITNIGEYAFYGCSALKNITIPNSVSSIGSFAFYDCSSLGSIIIPDSVTSIESYAFDGCSSLKSITIPNSVTSIGASAFSCSSLISITIPDSVTSIGEYAFSHCSSLTSITIPNSVTSIGSSAFSDCSNLTSVSLSDNLTYIASTAFSDCDKLEYTTYDKGSYLGNENNPYVALMSVFSNSISSLTIHNDTRIIAEGVLSGCSNLKTVNIPDNINDISFLSDFDINDFTLANYDNASYIGNSSNPYLVLTKVSSTDITTCNINKNTKFIYNAFKSCTDLTAITLPNGLKGIGNSSFSNCSKLTSITIPNSVTSIGRFAFACCSSLTSVTIPDSVTRIGSGAFEGCTNLTSITIPNSVTYFGSSVFYLCKNITIKCHSGSYAEQYAKSERKNYEIITETPEENPFAGKNGIVEYQGSLYYIINGEVCKDETIVKQDSIWYYVKNGKVDFSANKIFEFDSQLYYIKNGVVDFDSETLASYQGTLWYVKDGKIDKTARTLVNYGNIWYFVENGKIDYTAETLVKYHGNNFYIKNGMVDLSADIDNFIYGGDSYYIRGGVAHSDVTIINRTLTTVYNDGCTGDLYCNACREIIQAGRIVHANGEIGDSNGDGTTNLSDRIVLSRYLAGWNNYEYEISPNLADINKDGKVNQVDRIIYSRYLAGWAGYEAYFETT